MRGADAIAIAIHLFLVLAQRVMREKSVRVYN